jgi:hypothetical protein
MKNTDENPLLKEILADEPLAALRHASLDQGLGAMRRARRFRRMARSGTVALLPVLVIMVLRLNKPTLEIANPPSIPGSQASVAAAPSIESGVRMITDEELFALFPGRSLALVGKPGHQRLVFLDVSVNR